MSQHDARHLPALDGLRAFAIAWVLFSHFWTYPLSTPTLNRFAAAGWGGVDLFFVLSGFLITRILLADERRPNYYRRFYARRARRIVPVYYLVLLTVLVGFPLVSSSPDTTARDWLWYVAFLSNLRLAHVGWQVFALDVTWSLAIEEQFYLVWPALVRMFGRRRLVVLCAGLVLGLPLLRFGLVETQAIGAAWLDMFTLFRMDNLALGAILACVEPRLRTFSGGAHLAFVAAVVATVALAANGNMTRYGEVAVVVGHTILAVLSATMINAAVAGRSWLARVLSLSPLQALGRVSYGLYLYQGIVLAVVGATLNRVGIGTETLSPNPILAGVYRVAVISACTYAVAYVSFRYYETPILRWPGLRRPTPPAPGTARA